MTRYGTGSDPRQSPYGTPPESCLGAAGSASTQDARVPGVEQWQSPYVASSSMPVAPPYAEAVADDASMAWTAAPALGDSGTRDLPWYGIGPVDAVVRAYLKAFRFDGRASRGEYWWFSLYGIVMTPVAGFLGSAAQMAGVPLLVTLIVLVGLAHLPVGLSLTVRRLHDTGSSGWMYLLCLVPYLGGLMILIMCCVGPNPTGVRFDPPSVRPLDHSWGYPYS